MKSQFLERLRKQLQQHRSPSVEAGSLKLKEASVLVPLFDRNGEIEIVLTRRPMTLRKHAGQISFPGGRRDATDATLLHTALRETHEELGISQSNVEVIGMLGSLPTITSYYVTPFVGTISDVNMTPNRGEIDEVLLVPLFSLRKETRTIMAAERDVYVWGAGEHVVWGATYRMLDQLMSHVRAVQEQS